jgi:predicted aspartyl protease
MTFGFNRHHGAIVVPVRVWGRGGSGVLRCILDTGSTNTSMSPAVLAALGYDPAMDSDLVEVTTATNVTFARSVIIERIRAVGSERVDFPILSISLPPSANVDGLLGLDFFRGHSLLIDFRAGEITLG